MDWRLAISLVVLPLALYSQLRTRRVNALALWLSPLIYAVLAVHAAIGALSAAIPPVGPALLVAGGGALGYAQGRATRVFYDARVRNYRQQGGFWPLGYWAAALALRQGAALWLARGLDPSQAHLSTALTIDAVLTGLLSGRAVALLRRHPGLWSAGAAQLRGDTSAPPPAPPRAGGSPRPCSPAEVSGAPTPPATQ